MHVSQSLQIDVANASCILLTETHSERQVEISPARNAGEDKLTRSQPIRGAGKRRVTKIRHKAVGGGIIGRLIELR